ncbi:MAG: putative baseplate assembly protein [Gemmatimonadota bacterium]
MPLEPRDLDQRTFEQIVTEVRRRIPTFTPTWTDLNESDPGITLAQLFAFMTEQLLFQINQVPEKGFVTFLQMVGAELHPATPAVSDITLTNLDLDRPDALIPIDERTPVRTSGPPPGEKSPITFETTRPLFLLNGELSELVSRDCEGNITSHTTSNESLSGTFRPFGAAITTEDAFFLAFDLNTPGPWPAGTFRLRVNLAGSTDVGEPTGEAPPGTPQRIRWAYSSGTTVAPDGTPVAAFTPFEPVLDSTLELTRSGYLEFNFDEEDILQRVSSPVEPEAFENRFVLRARLRFERPYGAEPPELQTVRLNTVTARNLTTVRDERLGGSTGLPFQTFRLANTPVFPGSSTIEVNEATEGGGTETWEETLDLFTAGPEDRVYQLIPATGEVLFGNGVFGKIPPPDDGSEAEGNIKVTVYQFGGGRKGNVGAETLTRAAPRAASAPRLDATNVLPARGGDSEEPVSAGIARAPAVVRSRYRAVSAEDFEALAKETPDVRVARALALPNTRPGCAPGLTTGSVTVVLVPNALFEDTIRGPIPVPPHVAAAVRRFLDQRRLITTELFTTSATFRRITAEASIRVAPDASLLGTRTAALDTLNRYFHALVGGEDGTGWPFGRAVFFSRVFERLLDTPGVDRVDRLFLSLDGSTPVECEDLPIQPGELLVSGEHDVRVTATP